MVDRFTGNFTQQEPIPDDAIEAAVAVLRSGRLHRYNVAGDDPGETALLEREYAEWQGATYCIALASGGQALQIAMRASGVIHGDQVLTNAFTLAPVPGAIAAVGGVPVLVEIDENLRLDLDDLEKKAQETGAKFLLLSHMRGHLCHMDRLMRIADGAGIKVIEDCAHTMGATWNGTRSGNFGVAGCFSTQTYKHMNSGEGGFLTTDDPDLAARAVILSGSYMLHQRHGAAPGPEVFAQIRLETPNMSARMDNLRAAILRPQLRGLERNVLRWNERYDAVAAGLEGNNSIRLPVRPEAETGVGSSIQFRVPGFSADECQALVRQAGERGVELKWFGAAEPVGFTSDYRSWQYIPKQHLPRSEEVLSTLFDLRLPLTFSVEDCGVLARIISETVSGLR